ncbi:hypothetical protein HDU79_006702, partial [Rhizoclosmatium sp. JEL0117]
MHDHPASQKITRIQVVVLRLFLILLLFCLLFNIKWMFELAIRTQIPSKLQSARNHQKSHHIPVLYIRDENTTAADEKAWFTGRYRNGAVMLASANFGAANSSILRNMICSLATNAPLALDALVIWATDSEAALHLTYISTTHYNSTFGVYFYNTSSAALPTEFVTGSTNFGTYLKLMAGRNAFFARMVVALELNFIFTDLDVVYLKDPFVALNVPYGVSNVTVSSLVTPEGNTTLASLFDLIPDIVYSTDARTFYHLMVDPYEGNERIPNICGGFFFIRSNERTIRLWNHMYAKGLNDQWGMIKLLNENTSGFDAVMVNPLPAGIESRKDPRNEMEIGNGTEVIRVRILSQAAFRNALVYYEEAGTVGDDYLMLLEELAARGEYEVLDHPNYWVDAV